MNSTSNDEAVESIGDVAKSLGLTTRTLRYWEEVGIIESVERLEGGTRGYTPYYVRRIKFIMKLKDLGLTIKELQDLYVVYGHAKQTEKMIPKLVEVLDQHINRVDEKMAQLGSLRKEIVDYRQKMVDRFNLSTKGR
jgi:DNA-binding transcriptional MerR regulator